MFTLTRYFYVKLKNSIVELIWFNLINYYYNYNYDCKYTVWYNYDALLKYCNKVLQNYFAEGINKRRLAYVFSWSTSTSLTIRHNRRVSEGYNKRGREPSTRYERAPKALIKITNGKSARVSAALAETSPARLVIQPSISISRHASRTLREEDLLRINDNYIFSSLGDCV